MQLLHVIFGLTVLVSMCLSASDDRVRGWNKAQGLWGKRSVQEASQDKRTPQNWNKLNSLWGKRSSGGGASFDDDYTNNGDADEEVALLYKRGSLNPRFMGGRLFNRMVQLSPAQWQRANGLWGR